MRRASARSAAKSSARSGSGATSCLESESSRSRSRAASTSRSTARTVRVKGPKGQLEHTLVGDVAIARDGDALVVDARRRHAREPFAARSAAHVDREHGHRRVRGLRRRSSRSSASATARRRRAPTRSSSRSATRTPCTSRRPPGVTFEVPAADAHRRARLRQATRRPGRGRHPQDSQARAVQGQGHPLRRRARPAQGRQVGEVAARSLDRWPSPNPNTAIRRHRRVRKKVRGTAERPRLAVFRSNKHIYVQAIDDIAGRTVASASTMEADLRGGATATVDAAKQVGKLVGERVEGGRDHHGGVRPRRVQVPRPRRGGRRRRPRSRVGALRGTHARRSVRRTSDRDQPRRQGREGRPAVLVHRARGGRRRQRQRRPRLRQGQGGAGRDPKGHGRGQEEPLRGPARRLDDHAQ